MLVCNPMEPTLTCGDLDIGLTWTSFNSLRYGKSFLIPTVIFISLFQEMRQTERGRKILPISDTSYARDPAGRELVTLNIVTLCEHFRPLKPPASEMAAKCKLLGLVEHILLQYNSSKQFVLPATNNIRGHQHNHRRPPTTSRTKRR